MRLLDCILHVLVPMYSFCYMCVFTHCFTEFVMSYIFQIHANASPRTMQPTVT